MTNFTSRQVLSQLGLERRASPARTALTFGSVLGLGAALGAGALWAARHPRLRRFFSRAPTRTLTFVPAQPASLSRPHAAGA